MKKRILILLCIISMFIFGNELDMERDLVNAVKNNELSKVTELLVNGVDSNAQNILMIDNIFTPLTYAVSLRNEKVIDLLLEHGANIDLDKNGFNPLFMAVYENNQNMVTKLIELGAEADYIMEEGNSVIISAVATPHIDKRIISILIDNSKDLNKKNKSGMSPLLVSCYAGNAYAIQELLKNKVNVNDVDNFGASSLRVLIWRQTEGGKKELGEKFDRKENNYLIKLLLEHGADANSVRKEVNDYIEDEELRKLINSYM